MKLNFVEFRKPIRYRTNGEDRINILNSGMLDLSRKASDKLKDIDFVDLYIDQENKAFKLVKGDNYKLTKNMNNKYFYCRNIPLPVGKYYAENDYYVLKTKHPTS